MSPSDFALVTPCPRKCSCSPQIEMNKAYDADHHCHISHRRSVTESALTYRSTEELEHPPRFDSFGEDYNQYLGENNGRGYFVLGSPNNSTAYSSISPIFSNSLANLKRAFGRFNPAKRSDTRVSHGLEYYSSPISMRRSKNRVLLFAIISVAFMIGWRGSGAGLASMHTLQASGAALYGDIREYGAAEALPHALEGGCQSRIYDLDILRGLQVKYDLGGRMLFGHREVVARQVHQVRETLVKSTSKLFPTELELGVFDLRDSATEMATNTQRCISPINVDIPSSALPRDVNASSFLFGISTTYERLSARVFQEWSFWLTDGTGNSNGAGLHLLLAGATEKLRNDVRHKLANLGIDATVEQSDKDVPMAARYLSLVSKLYKNPTRAARKWLLLGDDDTFYPNFYIGTFSEDVNNLEHHGSQAFGGAGVILSISLAAQIATLEAYCSTEEKLKAADSGWGSQGDILLKKCIYDNTEIKLTLLKDLHQLDFKDDPSGFYESGVQPLSLHHFNGGMWHAANPLELTAASHILGEDAFMMRFHFADDYILHNGYSVAHYAKGIDFDLNQVEQTFGVTTENKDWNFDFMLGPLRKSLSRTGRKIAWDLVETQLVRNHIARQIYLKRKDDARWISDGEAARAGLDSIIIITWTVI